MHNLEHWLESFSRQNASDMYITVGSPASLRVGEEILPMSTEPLAEEDVISVLQTLISDDALEEFESSHEYNTAVNWRGELRLRVNVFRQRQQTGLVIRRIRSDIPTLSALKLPPHLGELALLKRGLILVVGPTGSGKTTTLASMLEHRNTHGSGHVVTVEDPIEFVHENRKCLFTQRDVGVDTYSFGIALKNALRQSPDVVVIGEIRDRETMEHAIVFAETGHLCMATLHANSANQAVERILNFFSEDRHPQILLNLSLNLKAVFSQRLVLGAQEKRVLTTELMLNTGFIRQLIQEGKIREIKEMIERGGEQGMHSFDQSLFDLVARGEITEETALVECDNAANLSLRLKQRRMAGKVSDLRSPIPPLRDREAF